MLLAFFGLIVHFEMRCIVVLRSRVNLFFLPVVEKIQKYEKAVLIEKGFLWGSTRSSHFLMLVLMQLIEV